MPLPSYFSFSVSLHEETGLVLVSVHDSRTKITVRTALPNSGVQTASIMAFAGARYSRSDLSTSELFREIKEAKKTANEKLATIFRNYGHASVADMALLFAYIENVPQAADFKFFNETSIGAGQCRSTRYQDFSNLRAESLLESAQNLQEFVSEPEYEILNQKYMNLQEEAVANYRKWLSILEKKFAQVYEIDLENKKELAALKARVFDTARHFLPIGGGNKTSFAYISSAREWARIISRFKASSTYYLNCLAEQLETLFAPEPELAEKIGYVPEAPDLIRYTKTEETTEQNLQGLQDFLNDLGFVKFAQFENLEKNDEKTGEKKGEKKATLQPISATLLSTKISASLKAVAQNIMILYPLIDENWLFDWLNFLANSTKKEMSRILLQNFDHHKQMGNQFRVNHLSFVIKQSYVEQRDFNRMRAWGRFAPMLETENYFDLYKCGYTLCEYLTKNPKLETEKTEFEADLVLYYEKLEIFARITKQTKWFPQDLFVNVLPFANSTKMLMHGSIKELSYMTSLRTRPGGHINYRSLAWDMAKLAAEAEDFLHIELGQRPDPMSRAEFLDRS